jgi:hypothetical protein
VISHVTGGHPLQLDQQAKIKPRPPFQRFRVLSAGHERYVPTGGVSLYWGFEQVERIELSSPDWKSGVIAVIRYLQFG